MIFVGCSPSCQSTRSTVGVRISCPARPFPRWIMVFYCTVNIRCRLCRLYVAVCEAAHHQLTCLLQIAALALSLPVMLAGQLLAAPDIRLWSHGRDLSKLTKQLRNSWNSKASLSRFIISKKPPLGHAYPSQMRFQWFER